MYDAPNGDYNELTWEDSILTFRNYPDGSGTPGGNAQLTFNFQAIESDGIRTIALDERVVHNFGDETISGIKTFASRPTVNGTGVLLSGEAPQADLSSTVSKTGNQTISGVKTFATGIDIFNGTSPQSLRIFNTTGTNSGEFGQIGWSGNTFIIAPQSTQSGINRNLEIHAAGFGRRIIVTNNGHVGIGTSAGDQTSHGIWVNPAAGQTSISHGGQILVNTSSVMFNANTRIFNNNAFTFGISQNNTTPMIRGVNVGSGFTSIQARLADNSNFVNFEANKLIANSGADIYFSGTAGTGVSGSHVGVLVSGLWNNTGQTYTGVRYNVTLNSGTSGLVPNTTNSLLNLAVNNTGVLNVNSKGQVLIQQLAGATVYDNTFEVRRGSTSIFAIRDDASCNFNNSNGAAFAGSINAAIRNGVITVGNGGYFGIGNTIDAYNYPLEHTVRLYRGADFVLDLRNASYPTSGHQFRVFNATGTNSGEFGVFGWQVTGRVTGTGVSGIAITGNAPSALVIGAQASQSGTLRDVILTGANIYLNPSGNVIINSVNPTGRSLPALSINNVWNDSTKLFTGVFIDITDSGSQTNSNYLNIRSNGDSVFTVRRSSASQFTDLLSPSYGFRFGTSAGTIGFTLRPQFNLAGFSTNTSLVWGSDIANLSYDLVVLRDAANIFAQRNGLNAQQFRVYNYTGTNSGEFGKIGWSSNVLQIGTEAGGSGSARALDLIVGGSRVLGASAGGTVSFGTNVGQSSTLVGWVGNCFMRPVNSSAGVLTLLNNALDDFDRLQFGGTTNAFPAIKRSGTDLQIRLADNSAYSTMDAQHRLQGTAPTTPTGSGTAGDMRYDNDYIYICTATDTWKRTPISGGW